MGFSVVETYRTPLSSSLQRRRQNTSLEQRLLITHSEVHLQVNLFGERNIVKSFQLSPNNIKKIIIAATAPFNVPRLDKTL